MEFHIAIGATLPDLAHIDESLRAVDPAALVDIDNETLRGAMTVVLFWDQSCSFCGAMDAENIEHQMTVMQAVKAYPAASWWAFVMSSTIVSFHLDVSDSRADATTRLWSHTAFS